MGGEVSENVGKQPLAMSAIDVWMQHPTRRFLTDPIFASLLRWNRMDAAKLEDPKHPIYSKEMSLASMDAGDPDLIMLT